MCGILAIFDARSKTAEQLRKLALECAKLIRHRGPDWSGVYTFPAHAHGSTFETTLIENGSTASENKCKNCVLVHERLSIIDPESGSQPLFSNDGKVVLCVNGEIYNHKKIREDPELKEFHTYKTNSDCEVIITLYKKYGVDCVKYLDGMFAFVIWDEEKQSFYASRDPIGIMPLYIGWRGDGGIVFASELKALQNICERFEIFKPGHYYTAGSGSQEVDFIRWFNPSWIDKSIIPSKKLDYSELRNVFEKAVLKTMMTDVPWGVLLSGGLDSSLTCSVACRHAAVMMDNYPKIHSFAIGIEGSPDLKAATKVADFLGTKHHSMTYTIQEGLDAITDVIWHLETYDVTTIRASTPMYLMARKIKALGVKMVLSGEGADEALGGYLYFHKAPNKEEFHKETVTKLSLLHYFDCLRANKAMSAFGVEPRVPFLDQDFLEYIMNIDPAEKMVKVRPEDPKHGKIEKYIMRKAFDTPENPYLPEEVLWRQKEQFSDGVGYGWIDSLREKAEKEITPMQWSNRKKRFPVNTPATKEAYLYRQIFHTHFPGESARDSVLGGPSIACSTPAAIEWDEAFKKLANDVGGDNSGRAVLGVHVDAYADASAVVGGKVKASEESNKKQKL